MKTSKRRTLNSYLHNNCLKPTHTYLGINPTELHRIIFAKPYINILTIAIQHNPTYIYQSPEKLNKSHSKGSRYTLLFRLLLLIQMWGGVGTLLSFEQSKTYLLHGSDRDKGIAIRCPGLHRIQHRWACTELCCPIWVLSLPLLPQWFPVPHGKVFSAPGQSWAVSRLGSLPWWTICLWTLLLSTGSWFWEPQRKGSLNCSLQPFIVNLWHSTWWCWLGAGKTNQQNVSSETY